MQSLKSQFGHPRGVLGWIIGLVMAAENRERIHWVMQQLDIHPTDRVLEIGFGPGVAIQQAAAQAAQGYVAGVDLSPIMIRQARTRNFRAVQAGRVDLRRGSVMDLPFEADFFDLAFTINSLHHWPDGEAGLAEMRRVLKPGGTVAIIEQPPSKITEEVLIRERGEVILEAMSQVGFHEVRPVYASLKRGMVVCALGTA
jgi:ubiquinone/menaquinone biosynthesis C-methylase UbiE